MTKDEFLKKLEDSLAKLNDDDRKKVLRKYKTIFTRKLKNGKNEKEIIEEFGDYNELVNSILKDHNIETPVQESAGTIADFFKEFLDAIENIIEYIVKQPIRDVIKLILQLILIILIISVLKLPVIFVRDLISGLFAYLFIPLSTVLIFCWRFLCEIVYVIIALAIFVKAYTVVLKPKVKKRKSSSKKVK